MTAEREPLILRTAKEKNLAMRGKLWAGVRLGSLALQIAGAMLRCTSADAHTFVGQKYIAEEAQCSVRTVQRHQARLRKLGILETTVEVTERGRRNGYTLYRLNRPICAYPFSRLERHICAGGGDDRLSPPMTTGCRHPPPITPLSDRSKSIDLSFVSADAPDTKTISECDPSEPTEEGTSMARARAVDPVHQPALFRSSLAVVPRPPDSERPPPEPERRVEPSSGIVRVARPFEPSGRVLEATWEPQQAAVVFPKRSSGQRRGGIRIPDDWRVSDELVEWAKAKGVDATAHEEAFLRYWRQSADQKAWKYGRAGWNLAFEEWIERAIEWGKAIPYRPPPGPKPAPSAPPTTEARRPTPIQGDPTAWQEEAAWMQAKAAAAFATAADESVPSPAPPEPPPAPIPLAEFTPEEQRFLDDYNARCERETRRESEQRAYDETSKRRGLRSGASIFASLIPQPPEDP